MKKKIPFLLLCMFLAGCGSKAIDASAIEGKLSAEAKGYLEEGTTFVSDETRDEIDISVRVKAQEDIPLLADELNEMAKSLDKPVRSITVTCSDCTWSSLDRDTGNLLTEDDIVSLDINGLYDYFGVER